MNYYLQNTILPLMALLLVSYSGFFIDRSSAPARVAAAVIPVLSCLTLQNGLYATVPRISYHSLLTDFCFGTLLFLCLNPVQYAFVSVCIIREGIAERRLKNLRRLCLEAKENERRQREYEELKAKAAKSEEERLRELELSEVIKREQSAEENAAVANKDLTQLFHEDENATNPDGTPRRRLSMKDRVSSMLPPSPVALLNSSESYYETRQHHKVSSFFKIGKERTIRLKKKDSGVLGEVEAPTIEEEEDFNSGQEKTMADRILKHLFNTLDRSKDGQLDASEIQYALRYFGHYVSRAQTMELIARVDKDGDLNVGYEEYQDLMHKIVTDWERYQPHEDFAFSFRSLSPAELTDYAFRVLYLPAYVACVPCVLLALFNYGYFEKEA